MELAMSVGLSALFTIKHKYINQKRKNETVLK